MNLDYWLDALEGGRYYINEEIEGLPNGAFHVGAGRYTDKEQTELLGFSKDGKFVKASKEEQEAWKKEQEKGEGEKIDKSDSGDSEEQQTDEPKQEKGEGEKIDKSDSGDSEEQQTDEPKQEPAKEEPPKDTGINDDIPTDQLTGPERAQRHTEDVENDPKFKQGDKEPDDVYEKRKNREILTRTLSDRMGRPRAEKLLNSYDKAEKRVKDDSAMVEMRKAFAKVITKALGKMALTILASLDKDLANVVDNAGKAVEKGSEEAEKLMKAKRERELAAREKDVAKELEKDLSVNKSSKSTEKKVEEPKKDEKPAVEEPKKDEKPAVEEPKKDEKPAVEEPKKDEKPAVEEPKKDEKPAVEEPKKDEKLDKMKQKYQDKSSSEIQSIIDIKTGTLEKPNTPEITKKLLKKEIERLEVIKKEKEESKPTSNESFFSYMDCIL